jgi:hypothetical protein
MLKEDVRESSPSDVLSHSESSMTSLGWTEGTVCQERQSHHETLAFQLEFRKQCRILLPEEWSLLKGALEARSDEASTP